MLRKLGRSGADNGHRWLWSPPSGTTAATSRDEAESHAAEHERVIRDGVAPCRGGIAHLRNVADPEGQAAHQVADAPDEVKFAIGKLQLWLATLIFAGGNPENTAPM